MGKRGPAKMPTNVATLRGVRSDRINHNEPTPLAGSPEPPEDMAPAVREVWDYTVAQLRAMKLATPADRDSLVCYCEAVVTHRKASAALARTGILVPSAKGNVPIRNPLLVVQRDAATLIRVYAREFGLTPSARADISMGGSSRDPAADYFTGT
jgi:P27 family predicted phage terminase small subunit